MKVLILNGSPREGGNTSSCYWNSVHGCTKGEAEKDLEGLATMRVLARNMSFLMKSIALGREKYGMPAKEDIPVTNFIR